MRANLRHSVPQLSEADLRALIRNNEAVAQECWTELKSRHDRVRAWRAMRAARSASAP